MSSQQIRARIHQNWWLPDTYFATLLGGEFANCYGQGSTPELAIISLKIRVNQLRNKSKTQ